MNWRLASNLEAYVLTKSLEKKVLYLGCPEKKKYTAIVQRSIKEPYQTIRIENNEFSLRLGKELEFQIKSNELPEPDQWYTVMNGTDEAQLIGNILKSSNYINGQFEGEKWEVVFDGKDSSIVSFVDTKMEEYIEYASELKRRINCEIFSKTRKWEPGHRYDSIDETIIYLGPVKYKLTDSGFAENEKDFKTVFAYVSLLRDEKSVEEIFNTRVIGKGKFDIKFLDKEKLMVDGGQVLEFADNMPSLYDQWERMIQDFEKNYINQENIVSYYSQISGILNILFYKTDIDDDSRITSGLREKVVSLIKKIEGSIYVKYWDAKQSTPQILSSQTKEANIEALRSLFNQIIVSNIPRRGEVYTKLLNSIGIDWEKLTEEVLDSWKPEDVFTSLENYIKYSDYFTYHDCSDYYKVLDQRVKSKNYYSDGSKITTTLDQLYSEDLELAIKEIITKGEKEFGSGLTDFKIINSGTRAKPTHYILAKITIDDILNYYQGELPEGLDRLLIVEKFWNLTVMYDQGDKLK